MPGGCLAADIAAADIAAAGVSVSLAVDMVTGIAVGCHGKYHGNICRYNRGPCRGSAMADGNPWTLPWHAPHLVEARQRHLGAASSRKSRLPSRVLACAGKEYVPHTAVTRVDGIPPFQHRSGRWTRDRHAAVECVPFHFREQVPSGTYSKARKKSTAEPAADDDDAGGSPPPMFG